jgi:hypothetical protein
MQLVANIPSSPQVVHATSAPRSEGQADRFRAAVTLVFLPNSIYDIVERGAAAADAAGRQVSAGDLLQPYLARVSADGTRSALLDAVEGALRVAPEFETERAALTDAANGVADLLSRAAADRTTGAAWDVAERFTHALDEVAAPIFGVSHDLDPSNA